MFAKHFEREGGSQSLQSFALFLLTWLCNSLWALTMSENSMSIQSRDVYMPTPTMISENQTERIVTWCCLPSHDMQWRAGYLFRWSLGTENRKESGFWLEKRSLRFTPPIENDVSYLFVWSPFSKDASMLLQAGESVWFLFFSIRHCCA